jgi:predicted permease
MTLLPRLRSWLRSQFRRASLERSMQEEMQLHIDLYEEDLRQSGVIPAEARRRALAAFGSVEARKDECRQAVGVRLLDELRGDLAFALRLLARSPSFTAVALLSLGLGIGANTAIFSVINSVLLRTLPVAEPGKLFFVDNSGGKSGGSSGPPYPCFELLRDQNHSLAAIAAFKETRFKLTIDGAAEEVSGLYASGNLFDLLGVSAVHGRVLAPADDAIDAARGSAGGVGVISFRLWERQFARDVNVLGKTVYVGTRPVTIVGVTPPDFFGLQVGSAADITVPITLSENNLRSRTLWWFGVIARLKPETAVEPARAELHALWDAYMTEIGQPREKRTYFSGIELVPAARGLASRRRDLAQPLVTMMSIVGLVLLIGCANVANLLLARAGARRHEFSVRLAIGASRGRLIRQLLTEGLVLVTLSTLVGFIVARWGASFLVGFLTEGIQNPALTVVFDRRVLGFAVGVGLLTALLFSLAPALHATRPDGARPQSPGVTPGRRHPTRLGQGLVVVQVSVAVVLLSGAALFARTLLNLYDVPAGFDRAGVLTMQVEATPPSRPFTRPTTEETRALYQRLGASWTELSEGIGALPGVVAAGAATMSPLSGRDRGVTINLSGAEPLPEEDRSIHVNQVTPGFLRAFGMRLLAGRWFTAADRASSTRVAVLNETAARRYFGDRNPIGHKVTFPGQPLNDEYEIVGVVADMRYETLREPDERMAYLPIEQAFDPNSSAVVAIRSAGDPARDLAAVRKLAAQTLPGGFVTGVATMNQRVERSLLRERLLAVLALCFGGLALTLGCMGLYGVMAFAVVRRTREIAVRVAIGASSRKVTLMVVRDTFFLVLAGVAIGLVAAAGAARFVGALFFGVSPGDPVASIVASLLLFLSALIAAFVPVRRATRVDPVIALRYE